MNKEIILLLLKRFFTSVVVLFLLITFIFFLVRLSPGDPIQKFISPKLSPELVQEVSKSFGLEEPLLVQYGIFLSNLAKGDFGISYDFRIPVLQVIIEYFPLTLTLAAISFFIQLLFGYLFARAAIKNAGKIADRFISKSFLIIYVIPSFVIGVVFIYFFSVQLDLLPSSGIKSIDHDELSAAGQFIDYLLHFILPVLTISLGGIALFYKYFRDGMQEAMGRDFVMYLKSMGYSDKVIFKNHILPNAIKPVISVAGIELGILLGGTLITEVIYGLPGMGRLTVNAILSKDFPLVIGCCFISGLLMVFTNFIADLVKVKIDKRLIKDVLK